MILRLWGFVMKIEWLSIDKEPPEHKILLLSLCFIDNRDIGYEVIYTGIYDKKYGFFVNSIYNDVDEDSEWFSWGVHNQMNIGMGTDSIKIEGYAVL